MNYKVHTKALSSAVKIHTDTEQYVLKHKLFSYNAELRDSNNKLIAHTKRVSWWGMKFNLSIDTREYELNLGLSGAVMEMDGEKVARSSGWNKLYCNNKVVAEFEETRVLLKPTSYSLNIINYEHEIALLISSCLNLKRHYIDQ